MTAPPDPGFAFYTHGRRSVDLDTILRELADERDYRRDHYPIKVSKGSMTELQLQHEINIIEALIEDFTRAAHPINAGPRDAIGFTWAAKLNELRGIIMRRRNGDPKRVAKGTLNMAEAMRRLITIEAAHAWYWHHGLDFMEGTTSEEIRQNIREEYARRERWARDNGYGDSPLLADAIATGDWSKVPRSEPPPAPVPSASETPRYPTLSHGSEIHTVDHFTGATDEVEFLGHVEHPALGRCTKVELTLQHADTHKWQTCVALFPADQSSCTVLEGHASGYDVWGVELTIIIAPSCSFYPDLAARAGFTWSKVQEVEEAA